MPKFKGFVDFDKKVKECTSCHEIKPWKDFYKHKQNTTTRRRPECIVCVEKRGSKYINKEKIENYYLYWARRTLTSHRHLGQKVFINKEDLVDLAKKTKNCSLCNCELLWKAFDEPYGPLAGKPSLDRKNNEDFLTLDNVIIICRKCNTTKMDRKLQEFYEYCDNILKFKQQKETDNYIDDGF